MDHNDLFAENLNSKRYFYNHANSLFHIEPARVVMTIKNPDMPPRQKVRIVNHTDFSQRCYVLPLESQQFYANFRNQELVAPGLCMHVEIAMILKRYTDIVPERTWLKVFCYDDSNLMIPIETADPYSPVANEIPRILDFGIVPLCESESFKIMISPNANESHISNVSILEPHVDVIVRHVQGRTVEHPSYVEVTYQPTSYTTMRCSLIIYAPVFANNDFPTVTFTGRCMPPPFKDQIDNFMKNKSDFFQQLQNELKKRKIMFLRNEPNDKLPLKDQLDHAEQPDKEGEKEIEDLSVLRGPLGRTNEEDEQLKKWADEQFKKDVEDIRNRTKQMKIHPNMENLGQTGNEEVKYNFDIDWEQYMKLKALPIDETVYTLDEPKAYRHRIIKQPENKPESKVNKNPPCAEWFIRFHPLCKFIQAARQIIIRNRLMRQLAILREHVDSARGEASAEERGAGDTEPPTEDAPPPRQFFGSAFQFAPAPSADLLQPDYSWAEHDTAPGE